MAGTVLTVGAGVSVLIKEITFDWDSSAVIQAGLYVLPSGDTDLTSGGNVTPLARARAETKTIYPIAVMPNGVTHNHTLYTRNTLLEAGDSLRVWITYGAVTPTTQFAIKVSGDQF